MSLLNAQVFADADELGQFAAQLTTKAAREAIAARGVFHLVMAGGNTPRLCYEKLRDMDVDWSRTHIWFGDERCLPVGDAGRNDRMADETLLNYVDIPAAQVHRMQAELGPEQAAEKYAALLADAPVMDMVHLGMGEDGHTASLFPGHATLADDRLAIPEFDSQKAPPQRVSLGLNVLNAARQKLILAAGAGKSDALKRIQAGEKLPVAMIEDALWLLDRTVAGKG
ncbi:MAG: 6-phosphogluconolactonase [Mariprofundaceae bacterium]|nr:6-phosphogluconolactonase [Mariprofundaceae bacterium]